ncbi:hypothetical protein [Streptomyces sp. NPDC031705]|uniref:hypothetical protein n=1 Tax=Streptomyces sp. NPDC031705 TaxID=3155729 RepID=UPI0033DD513B
MITTVDWFANSTFVPRAAREEVSRALDRYFDALAACVKSLGITDANVYVGGSLARGEPSVTRSSGTWRLFSDLDLLAVVEGPAAGHPVHGLAAEMRARQPSFDTTVFVVDAADFAGVRSFIGHDAWPMFEHPVVEGIRLRPPPRPRVGRRERFELFTHQLNSLVLFPHEEGGSPVKPARHHRKFAEIHLLKTLMEAMRISLPDPGAANFGALCTEPFRAALAPVLDSEQVADIVRAREVYTGDFIPPVSAAEIIEHGLGAFFGLDRADEFSAAVTQAVTQRIEGHSDLLTLFQHMVPLLFVMSLPEYADDVAASTAVLAALSAVDPADIVDSGAAKARLEAMSAEEMAAGFARRDPRLLSDLLELRGDYYHHLGNHNFGRSFDGRYGTS